MSGSQPGMGMHDIVVLHPAIHEGKGGNGNWDPVDSDVVALERFHECLGHAAAFRAFNLGDVWHQVKRQGDLDAAGGSENRAVVGQPLCRMRGAKRSEGLLDGADHHVPDHLARGAGDRRHPGNRFTVVAIKDEGPFQQVKSTVSKAPLIPTPSRYAGVRLKRGAVEGQQRRPPFQSAKIICITVQRLAALKGDKARSTRSAVDGTGVF